MRFKDLSKFDNDEYDSENEEYKSTSRLEDIAKNVQMNGITLLDLSPAVLWLHHRHLSDYFAKIT